MFHSKPTESAADFLKMAHLFQLGVMPTEQPHPKTAQLSEWCQSDLPKAIQALKEIDQQAIALVHQKVGELRGLRQAILECLSDGGRVFLCGCGATGRLSLTLETIWREVHGDDRLQAFMAGGDIALVHAIEGFEDYPQYGAKQLMQMGFTENDLLISSTEGGETPFVIGATEKAAELSKRKPFFLYCNPKQVLSENVERSKRVFDNEAIVDVELFVGQMALAGSTRMQASTILQLFIGLALFVEEEQVHESLSKFEQDWRGLDKSFLQKFIVSEADCYQKKHHIVYRACDYAITIFTDTTERAPTFSLPAFDSRQEEQQQHSLCYVFVDGSSNQEESWCRLLSRVPKCLEWSEVGEETSKSYLTGFDFSDSVLDYRTHLLGSAPEVFTVSRHEQGIHWQFKGLEHTFKIEQHLPLFEHLLLKMLLNIHSTLVMGLLGRYRNNLMTWVSPTNGKLVDRACRYVQCLCQQELGIEADYAEVVETLFQEIERLQANESVVLKTFATIKSAHLKAQ